MQSNPQPALLGEDYSSMGGKTCLVIGILLPFASAFSKSNPSQEKAIKEAENFGQKQKQKNLDAIHSFVPNPFISNQERNQSFSSEEARKNILNIAPKECAKQPEKETTMLTLNLPLEESANQVDLNGFIVDLEGLVKEEPSTNSEKLPSIVEKLSVFRELKKELERTNGADARKVTLFAGTKHKCSRNVLNHTLYDCCSSMSGLATKANLAKCDAEEIALSRMKEEGRCHYVGEYDKKALGMVKKSERRVFCCFSSKLACILQEQGRVQLRRGWGKAKKPDCGGFTPEEIKGLDFTKLDLREAIPTQVNQGDFQNKLSSFQKKIQESNLQSSGN
jgi:conjugal transfer mating pair stabilization protein TraN